MKEEINSNALKIVVNEKKFHSQKIMIIQVHLHLD